MRTQKTISAVSALLLLLGTTSAAMAQPNVTEFHEHSEASRNRMFDRPQVNPSPERVLEIRGSKDANIEIWLHMNYQTTVESCDTQTFAGRLMGAPNVRQNVTDSVRLPAGQTAFSVKFFLDRYLPGRCNWQPYVVLHSQFEPGLNAGPAAESGFVLIRPDGRLRITSHSVCRQTRSQLSCSSEVGISPEQYTVSIDGAVVEADFSLEPESNKR